MALPAFAKAGLAALAISSFLAATPPAQKQAPSLGDDLLLSLLTNSTRVAMWD